MALQLFKIADVTVASPQANIEFASIPQGYTDLMLVISTRDAKTTGVWSDMRMRFNSDTSSSYPMRLLFGDGASVSSLNQTDTGIIWVWANSNNSTANTFSNAQVYIPNYTGSNNKSISIDAVVENNGTTGLNAFTAGLWSNSAAISNITIIAGTTNFLTNSTATLYGVL